MLAAVRTQLRPLFRLALPLALFQLGGVAMNLVDTLMVGRIGPSQLAAVSLGVSVYFVVMVFGMGAVTGIEPLVAQAVGAGEQGRAWRALVRGLVLALLLSLPLIAVMLVLVALLDVAGIDPEVVSLTREYLYARAPGVIPELLYTVVRTYLHGHGQTRPIVLAVVIGNVVNAPADYLLIFGGPGLVALGLVDPGIPALGLFGAGIATSFSTLIQLLVVAPPARFMRPHEAPAPDDDVSLAQILKIGVPVGLHYMLEVGVFALVAVLMGRISPTDLAAHEISLKLSSTSFRMVMGISSASAVLVGQRIGSGDKEGTLAAGLASFAMGSAVMCLSGLTFVSVPELLARAFTPDDEVVKRASRLIRVAAAFQLSDGLQAVAGGALRGAGDTRFPFVMNLVAYWGFALPVALVLAFSLELGAVGLWWGLTLGLTVAAVGQVARFVRRARSGYVRV